MKALKDKPAAKKGKSDSRLGLAKRGKYGSNSGDGKPLSKMKLKKRIIPINKKEQAKIDAKKTAKRTGKKYLLELKVKIS